MSFVWDRRGDAGSAVFVAVGYDFRLLACRHSSLRQS